MAWPIHTIDLPETIFRPRGGTMQLVPDTEREAGGWSAIPRSGGPRHMLWRCELEMATMGWRPDLGVDQVQSWEASIARLAGTTNAFRIWDPYRRLPLGVGAGIYRRMPSGQTWLIDGSYEIDGGYAIEGGSPYATVETDAPRYANVVHMSGFVPSSTVLRDGDLFGLGGNLYMVNGDHLSDSAGEASIAFLWQLWKPALAGDQVQLVGATGRFVLAEVDGGTLRRNLVHGEASLTAVEVPYVD